MAVVTSLPALLDTLTLSLSSATESVPEASSALPPKDGISLLDVKNELLLSYLQNLVFLIILKLRNHRSDSTEEEGENLDDVVVKKLVELRVYLERGVRPLEGRLKYQIDKVLRAADDAARAAASTNSVGLKNNQKTGNNEEDSSDNSEEDSEAGSSKGVTLKAAEIEDLQYRPNPASLMRPATVAADEEVSANRDGVYRPPRITATAMPITTGPREKTDRRAQKSATLDEFISTELSEAPIAEDSIGLGTASGGRRTKSDREKREEAERKEYEEKNYVRLPKESKKDRAKKGGRKDAGYGGEDWRGLDEGIDRIGRLTTRKGGEGKSVLDKSRKRATEDGPKQNGGGEVGQGFQKRLKTLDGGRRDRGRR